MKRAVLKPTFVVLSLLVLNSCTIIIGDYKADIDGLTKPTVKGCDKFIMPSLRQMPDVPTIPDKIAHDRDTTDAILVNNIGELREYIKYIRSEYQKAFDKHIKSCQ